MSSDGGLDGSLIAAVSEALHKRCSALGATDHRADDHDHGAVDVVTALHASGWICTHARTHEGEP